MRARLDLLGSFAWSVDGTVIPRPSTKKARALAAYIVLNRRADAARERLIELLWPNSDADSGRVNLRAALWSVRRSLQTANLDPDACLRADRSVVRWLLETDVDVEQFEMLTTRREPESEARALQLYRGDFLEGDYDDWPSSQRAALANLFEDILARNMQGTGGVEAARRLLERNPYDENARARLIEDELRIDRAAGIANLERYRDTLRAAGDMPSVEFEERFANFRRETGSSDNVTLGFAGRFEELAAIESAREAALAGARELILVHGGAGIGKSTLIERATMAARACGMSIVLLRCLTGDSRPFGPWYSLFREVTGDDLTRFASEMATPPADAIALAIVAKLPSPVMLVIEDVHELGGDAFKVAVAIARTAFPRCLMIFTVRPEGQRAVRTALSGASYHELALQPLTRVELATALAAATGLEQSDLLKALWERSRGHPFFAASLLTALAQRGALVRDGRVWRWNAQDTPLELPADLRRSLEARLRSTGPGSVELAGALAIDPLATADDLVGVLALDESRTFDALDDLLTREIFVEPRGTAQFAFAHELIREVALGTVNAGRRVALHRAFFARLRGQADGGTEVSLRCARHLRGAGATLQSGDYYLAAAVDALSCNASNEARARIAEAIHAIERLERAPIRDMMLARLEGLGARIAASEGDASAAQRHASEATALARAAGDPDLARTLVVNAVVAGLVFRPEEQRAYATEAAELAESDGARDVQAAALSQLACAQRLLGERDHALTAGERACSVARSCNDWASLRSALEERLYAQITWWQFDEALETAAQALDPSLQLEPVSEASLLVARAQLWHALDLDERAQADLQKSQMVARELGSRRNLAAEPRQSLTFVAFAGTCLHAELSIARGAYDDALLETAQLQASPLSALDGLSQTLTLLHLDALLGRACADDTGALRALELALGFRSAGAQNLLGWSRSPTLGRARVAARTRPHEAGPLLRVALNSAELDARRTPLLADAAFAHIAAAAAEIGDDPVHARATMRAEALRTARLASFTVGLRAVH